MFLEIGTCFRTAKKVTNESPFEKMRKIRVTHIKDYLYIFHIHTVTEFFLN